MLNQNQGGADVTLEMDEDVNNASSSAQFGQRFRDWARVTSRLLPNNPPRNLMSELDQLIQGNTSTNISPTTLLIRNSQNDQQIFRLDQRSQAPGIYNPRETIHINLGPGSSSNAAASTDNQGINRSHEVNESRGQPLIPVFDVDAESSHADRLLDQNPPQAPPGQGNDRDQGNNDLQNASPDLYYFLRTVFKYAPFFLILLTKFSYDHREGLLTFITLLITFYHANGVVKDELAKQANRSIRRLSLEFIYTVCCIFFIDYVFDYGHQFSSLLVLIPSYTQPLDVWQLLWIVCVTDFILKLITVDFKILVTCLPAKILPFPKRGKVYFFLEAASQLFRSLIPVQPWLYYLLEAYQGTEKVMGVILSTAYIISKSVEIVKKGTLFKTAGYQLLKYSNLGVCPNNEQLLSAGRTCPICHDEYSSPIRLSCTHIFCEICVSKWLDRTQTCPLCRAQVVEESFWRDGSTSQNLQFY